MAGSSYATASRRKILEYLKNSNDHTVTAADVDEYLKKHDSEVNITTIYRYLDKLAKDGTVIKYVALFFAILAGDIVAHYICRWIGSKR